MKIAFIITGLARGGAEMMLHKLLSQLNRGRIQPYVVSLRSNGALKSLIEKQEIPVHDLGLDRSLGLPEGILRLRRIVQDIDVDVIQGWMYHGNLAALCAAGAAKRNVPVIWNIRQSLYDLKKEKRLTAAVIRLGAKLSKRPAAILYNSRTGAEQHEHFGYASQHRRIIPNGFDCDVFRPDAGTNARMRQELGISAEAIVVGLVARYHPMKDHHNFIRAAAVLCRDVSNVHFILAGFGVNTENSELTMQISKLGLDRNMHLLGDRGDVADLTAALDIATSSSAWGEGFPNVIGEAMACGVPCAVTDVGDSAWIVGKTGHVVPSRDPEAMARAWHELIKMGKSGRAQLGATARQRIRDNFSLDAIVRQYETVYTDLVYASAG